jgi:hypothetical protein
MPRYFCMILVGLLPVASNVYGQVRLRPGVWGGINRTTVTGLDGAETRSGPVGGAFLTVYSRAPFALQAEVLYARQGFVHDVPAYASLDGSIRLGGYESRYTLAYLMVPVTMLFRVPTFGKLVPSLLFGPAAGVLLDSRLDVTFDVPDDAEKVEVMDDIFEPVDVSLLVGAELVYERPGADVLVAVRYQIGLLNIVEGGAHSLIGNRGLALMVGVRM